MGVFGSGHGLKEPEKNYDASEPLDWRLGIQSLILGLKMVRLLWYLNFQNSEERIKTYILLISKENVKRNYYF